MQESGSSTRNANEKALKRAFLIQTHTSAIVTANTVEIRVDKENIERKLMHLKRVRRIQNELEYMSPDDARERIDNTIGIVQARWENCQRSFTAFFSTLNEGNPRPKNTFDIKLRSETVDNLCVDTMVRIQRSEDNSSFHIRPYAILNQSIVDQTLGEETFSSEYRYEYGTYHNQIASIRFFYDGNCARIYLDRLNGYRTNNSSNSDTAVLLAAIEDYILPSISSSEDSLILLWEATSDQELNPHYANKISGIN